MMTRNRDIKLEFTNGASSTDGHTIWINIPIRLGDNLSHERDLCGKRNELAALICPSCDLAEEIEFRIYHEVAHIAFESFIATDAQDRVEALASGLRLEAEGKPDSKRGAKLTKQFEKKPPKSFAAAAGMISPWLINVTNVGEDGRVNKAMMNARPGTKTMFRARLVDVFTNGIETSDNERRHWRDQDANLQALIATYCKVTDFDYSPYLDPEVVEALAESDDLDEMCRKLGAARTPREVFYWSVPVLEELRRLGFCKSPDDVEDDPEESGEGDDNGEEDNSESESDGSSETSSGSENESGESGKSDSSSDSSEREQDSSPKDPDQGDRGNSESQSEPSDDSSPDTGSDPTPDPQPDGTAGEGEDNSATPGEPDSDQPDPAGSESADEQTADPAGSAEPEPNDGNDDAGTDQSSEGNTGETPGQTEPEEVSESESGAGQQDQPEGTSEDSPPQSGDQQQGSNSGREESEPGENSDGGQQDNPEGPDDKSSDSDGQPDDQPPETNDEAQKSEETNWSRFQGLPDCNVEEVADAFETFAGHEAFGDDVDPDDLDDQREVGVAIGQLNFDQTSHNVDGMELVRYDGEWHQSYSMRRAADLHVEEAILGPSLGKLRRMFSENKRSHFNNDLNSGRINARVLGRRIPTGDDRLFRKKTKQKKRDYFVTIGLDISGSTARQGIIELIKESAFAMAELMARLGVDFAVYAHTGDFSRENYNSVLKLYEIKSPTEQWSDKIRNQMGELGPEAFNLDGHTLEQYRKITEAQRATDKIIFYYTDGAMPAENYKEELDILQREIKICRARAISLVGIGIKNDDPTDHGLDTVRLDALEDIPRLIAELEKRISR